MSLVFFGTPVFAIPSLKALLDSGEKVEAVVTQRDKKQGRGRRLMPPPVKEFALERGLRVLQPAALRDEALERELASLSPEVMVVVAYGKILPPALLRIPPMGVVNVHASLLPRYRGASPIAWAIMNGEAETGVTTMLMNEGLDEGDVLLAESVRIEDEDTAGSLSERLSAVGARLLVETLRGMREGSVRPAPQAGEPSFAPPFKKEDGRVDWSRPARELYNFVRGMDPWPGAFSSLSGERIRLLRVRPAEGRAGPGEIVLRDGGILVGTGDGLLAIEELQPEGKRPMAAAAFLSGRKVRGGEVFQ
ncbi:MAG: methionyl-tRNA formyltransferase [Thermodesulfovibrionales bacterium]